MFLFAAHILESGERTVPRKSRNTRGVWDDLDSRLDATDKLARDFFSDTQAVSVGQIPASELELSDEEITDHAVEVRVDSDGFVSQVPEEESAPAEMLELMPVPLKLGATDWGSQFAEIHARVQELQCVSKPTSNRYVVRAHGNLKVSSLPSGVDFICDVCIVARRVLTPALYRVWKEIYYEGFGKDAASVPESVQQTIMQLCGDAWKRAGLLPFSKYWNVRVDAENTNAITVVNVVESIDGRNARRRAKRALRAAKKRAARSVISTIAVAA